MKNMKNKMFKIIVVSILVIIMSLLFCTINYKVKAAATFNPDLYINGIERDRTEGTDGINSIGRTIIGILRGAGTVLSVIVLIVIGIKYMMGSVEEKATYKQTLMPYLIGAIMVFGITNILPIIVEVAKAI
ncbi:MAG: hypothetical protein IKF17_03615 [Clostridia bacterium]|nr:hypothetical protein [Clostridia bacterium]